MRFQDLHAGFGAEVLDFDVLQPSAPAEVEELKEAFDEYQFLLFRCGRRMEPERQLEIVSWFGPPVDNTGDGKAWSVLQNEEAAGRMRLPFHSDFTYTEIPLNVISLQAIELPRGGSTTSYVSGVHSWATLSPERQHLLEGMTVRHVHHSSISSDLPEFIADHPVRFTHPRTGRPVLFVTEHHATSIHEVDHEESDRLLAELFDHLYEPENVYVHHWELYDLLLWDNLAIQHARSEEADLALGHRALQRVASSDVSYLELIDRAREQQRHRELQEI